MTCNISVDLAVLLKIQEICYFSNPWGTKDLPHTPMVQGSSLKVKVAEEAVYDSHCNHIQPLSH
jgi:hypothetical protein